MLWLECTLLWHPDEDFCVSVLFTACDAWPAHQSREVRIALPEAEGALALRVIALRSCLPIVQHASQLRRQRKAAQRRRKLHQDIKSLEAPVAYM